MLDNERARQCPAQATKGISAEDEAKFYARYCRITRANLLLCIRAEPNE